MAGYSGTPLPKKLGVDGERSVLLLNAPEGFEKMIGGKKGDKRIRRRGRTPADVVLLFVKNAAGLKRGLAGAIRSMAEGGGLWIAWPKKTSPLASDVSENDVRDAGLAAGVVDYKVCTIDENWSGLKFARRRKDRKSVV
jgi:hypothetical protein